MSHISDFNTQNYKPLRARALTALSYIAGELAKSAEAIDATEGGRKAFVAEQKASGVLEEVRWLAVFIWIRPDLYRNLDT
jgi:hypothetical protein